MNQQTKVKTCPCGAKFEVEFSEPVFGMDFSWMEPDHCEACTDKMNESARIEYEAKAVAIAEEWIEWFRKSVARSIPPIFQSTETNHPKFNMPAWEAIKSWEPTKEKPWLGLSGGTGGCKTRIAYLAAQSIIERMARRRAPRTEREKFNDKLAPDYAFVTSYSITETIMAQFGCDDSRKNKARSWLDDLRDTDLLMIDDIGKGKLSPAVSSELFALIDHRHVNQLPMIWTSNSTPEQIAGSMSDDMGAPFAGRINESSKIFKFK